MMILIGIMGREYLQSTKFLVKNDQIVLQLNI